MDAFNAKRVADPVHGSINLSNLEVKIVGAGAFQRLRRVKHLGLGDLVFPSADFSRFAHSLGTCHVMGRTLAALSGCGLDLSSNEIQRYRIAALLHDIGHYPFSHAMEYVVKKHYANQLLVDEHVDGQRQIDSTGPLTHERLSKLILEEDELIRQTLNDGGYDPSAISSIFMREEHRGDLRNLNNLMSSDLDADRIDYLLRTAHHTGLPYGAVDLDYLLAELSTDASGKICLSHKAVHAAEHLLLGRYFDYQQIAVNKTVMAFELVLKDILKLLLEWDMIDCSTAAVRKSIRANEWEEFDDASIWSIIRELKNSSPDDAVKLKASAIVDRQPPRLLWTSETVATRFGEPLNLFELRKRMLTQVVKQLANQFGISPSLWLVGDFNRPLTKVGSTITATSAMHFSGEDEDSVNQSVWILPPDRGVSRAIAEIPYSLMNVLANYAMYALRLYVVLPPDQTSALPSIMKYVEKAMAG